MRQHVQIEGMTCQNCRQKVENRLTSFEGISNVSVSLEKAEAHFEVQHSVSISILSDYLGEKYTVKNLDASTRVLSDSKLKQLRPLFLIFFYVIAGSIFLSYGKELSSYMTNFMGLFYIVFSFFKFLDYSTFPESFQRYDPIAKRFTFYAWVYPFIETSLGLCFLLQWQMEIALWLTLLILGSTTLGVLKQLLQKNELQCACLGTALNLPMTEATLIENIIMLSMAIGMILGIQ